jgi:hypothetical protein
MSSIQSFPECDYMVSMADVFCRRVEETEEALRDLETRLAAKFGRLVAEETQPLRAALEASKSECEAHRRRAAELAASRLAEETPAIPGLPNHLVVAHILGSDTLHDPTDLVRLTAVSRGMRAAVAATKRAVESTKTILTVKEPTEQQAVQKGYLSTLKHMHSLGRLSHKEHLLCAEAARCGDLEELKALRADECPWNERTCANAAWHGHLEVLKWAHENDCPWNEATCANAAYGGHLEVLKWARANGCPWDEWTCRCAAYGGHLDVLKWARANGCPWNERTCANAAYGGHLEVLKWAHENDCPWDEKTCVFAAYVGHLEVLKWARENGCPWNERTRKNAKKKWPEVFARR